MLLEEVTKAYHGAEPSARPSLLEVMSSMYSTADHKARAETFWAAQLEDYANPDPAGIPDLSGRAATQSTGHIATRCPVSIPRDQLSEAARSMGGSLGHLIAIAWGVVVGAYTESTRVVFGQTISARRDVRALGPLISVTPLLVSLEDGETAKTAVRSLATLAQEATGLRQGAVTLFREALRRNPGKSAWETMFVLHPEEEDLSASSQQLWSVERDVVPLFVEHGWALNVELKNNIVELEVCADSARM